jgi:manganese efflux pump family protein
MLATLLIALALSTDAFAVSIASGICVAELSFRHALRASFFFGIFQFAMPIIGWFLGGTFRRYIQGFDHWIAFGLLAFVGGKMIRESFGVKDPHACSDEEKSKSDIRSLKTLLLLSVATSIDALAVGLSYSMIHSPIFLPSLVIGLVTFALSMVGVEFGKRVGAKFERWAVVAGGVVLIGIGVKLLLEHIA